MASARDTYGALVLGGLIAMFLTGIVATQVYMYRRGYPEDRLRNKVMVAVIWSLDLIHSAFVCLSVFRYVIKGVVDDTAITHVSWTVSVTVSITGVLTFLVHCFFTIRVWTLSKHNKLLCGTILILAFLRMVSAFGTVAEMQRFHTWRAFHHGAGWIFTTGLAISATVDFIIVFALLFYLKRSRTGFTSMDQIIDMIMVYTIENGLLTTICTVASFVCWMTMHNFIFLAIHFGISKLYANSFLATLNARSKIKERTNTSFEQHNSFRPASEFSKSTREKRKDSEAQGTDTLQISVMKTVVTDVTSVHDIESVEPAYVAKRASGSSEAHSSF